MVAKREMIITTGLLAIVGGSAFLTLRPAEIPAAQNALERRPIRVSVAGEVAKPGVYTLPWGARAEAAIKAAGGTTQNAELSLFNPAEILGDGEQVRVPSKLASSTTNSPSAALPGGERINLNTATQAQLETLPGVGPKMAARIIAARPLKSIKDLDAVSGIGPSMLRKLEPLVRF
ncbi:MAG: helix-hairpin-helix domain-containing protein [Deinococcales bacterium]